MQIQTTMRSHFIPTRKVIIKRHIITNASRDVGTLEPHTLLAGCEMVQPLWKTV